MASFLDNIRFDVVSKKDLRREFTPEFQKLFLDPVEMKWAPRTKSVVYGNGYYDHDTVMVHAMLDESPDDIWKSLPDRLIVGKSQGPSTMPPGFFAGWYGFLDLRQYVNPHIRDSYLLHELTHMGDFAREPAKNWVSWSDKMVNDEFHASIVSEMLMYAGESGREMRKLTFPHEILVDHIPATLLGDNGDAYEECYKVRKEAIVFPTSFVEAQVQNYQHSNRVWCGLYARCYREVEALNLMAYAGCRDSDVGPAELVERYVLELKRVVEASQGAIDGFAEYYKKVNETFGNHLYNL